MTRLLTTYETGKPGKYYIDGKRKSRDVYEHYILVREMKGKRLNCFHTKAIPLEGGRIKRYNYSSI